MSGDLHRLPYFEAILSPGQVVGGTYRVDKLMAEGGMAAVWAGHNERTGRRVALKVILRSMASIGEAAALFRSEALAASKINHPNVVSVFDVIDHGSMTCIVMELLDGETLDLYLARNGPLSLQETIALLLPAMRGVAAAHAQGVVHRDLKPGNIFLCQDVDGRFLTSKVLDFGIATMLRRAGESAIASDLQIRLGTPTYMSPEAIQCSPEIDGRTDVYGFGVLIFEALTGKVPFPGEPGIELFASILDDPPPRVTEYRPDLPPEVVHIVDRALAKSANQRFPDMDHLIRAVEDQLLPPSRVPRALTPMQGVLLNQLIESKSDAAYAPVGTVIEKDASGLVNANKTRVLFSLTGPSSPGAHGGGHLRRRAAIGAGFAVVIVVTACLAIAARPIRSGMGKHASPSSIAPVPTKGPQVIPLAATPNPVLPPIASSSGGEIIRIIDKTPAPLPARRVMRKVGPADWPRTTASRIRSHAPRAGRLSQADF